MSAFSKLRHAKPIPIPSQMKALRFLTLALPILSIAVLFLASCASSSSSGRMPSSEGLFEDPNDQRLKIQEDMTRVTRELTIF
jgi:hypothetical protein